MEKKLRKKLPGGEFRRVPPVRSKTMRAIRGRGNQTTEVRFRFALVRGGISGWKQHAPGIKGNPDIVFPRKKLTIFLDGCFWHGCRLCGHIPRTNRLFWRAKILRNIQRDATTNGELAAQGFRVLRLWEHDIIKDLHGCIEKLRRALALRKPVELCAKTQSPDLAMTIHRGFLV